MDHLDRSLARRLLALALGLGLIVELAFDGPAFGINVPIVVATMLVAGWVVRRQGRALDPLDAWLPVTAVVVALLVAIRGDEFLAVLDIVVAFAFCGATLVALSGVPVTRRSASVIATMGAWALGGLITGPVVAMSDASPSAAEVRTRAGVGRHVAPVLRGLVIGVPLAVIFAVLFASADPIFRRATADLLGFRLDLGDLPGRVLFTMCAAWLAAGALSVAARGIPDVEHASLGAAAWTPPADGGLGALRRSIGVPEALVILGTIDLVIGLFVGLQIAYLFGGLDTLAAAGITYADYARRGFFELVAAACLAAAVVVAMDAMIDRRPRVYVAALLTLIALTTVVLASAAMRLRLYQDAYGWTELRLYVLVAIATMAVGLVAMAVLVARDRTRWLGHAFAVIGVVSLVGLNLLAPGGFVAARNIERVTNPALVPADGHPGLDDGYVAMLPDDAIPVLVAALPSLPAAERVRVLDVLRARTLELDVDPSYRSPLSWNLGREAARAALESLPPQ